ncbi:hypothetical protein [Pedobacter aquatilis]|uniref:hypothetical protein n=1 Tax=Pedobacter aquatilis TaxID=351343 RepID=UPI0029313411|nr:hypothetical protein [Pedobacter aquatilis]
MKKFLLILLACTALACKKDADKTLTSNTWAIESTNVSPAMTIGNKTSSNYIELMGPSSCDATWMLSFATDGTFTSGANGALCDLFVDNKIRTWKKDGDQIFLSTDPSFPFTLKKDKLTQTKTISLQNGIVYTFNYVYKAK